MEQEDTDFILKRVLRASAALNVNDIHNAEDHINEILDKYKDEVREAVDR